MKTKNYSALEKKENSLARKQRFNADRESENNSTLVGILLRFLFTRIHSDIPKDHIQSDIVSAAHVIPQRGLQNTLHEPVDHDHFHHYRTPAVDHTDDQIPVFLCTLFWPKCLMAIDVINN